MRGRGSARKKARGKEANGRGHLFRFTVVMETTKAGVSVKLTRQCTEGCSVTISRCGVPENAKSLYGMSNSRFKNPCRFAASSTWVAFLRGGASSKGQVRSQHTPNVYVARANKKRKPNAPKKKQERAKNNRGRETHAFLSEEEKREGAR